MATIETRTTRQGITTYRVKIRRKGASPHTATFPTRAQARKWAMMIEGAVVEGRYFPGAQARNHTVGEMLDRYRRAILPQKRLTTIPGQTQQLRFWQRRLGSLRLVDLTPAVIAAERDYLAQTRAPGTVNRYLAALSHACTIAAQEWHWLETNPVRLVKKPKEPRGRVRCLTEAERARLLRACSHSRNPSLLPLVLMAVSTGARKGELLALRWADIDLHRGVVTFHETKNGERRTIPVPSAVLSRLHPGSPAARVFPHGSYRRAWESAVHRAGLADFHFHDLRHCAASYLAMNGASLLEIADILGHRTLAMVRRYAHLSEPHTRSVMTRMHRAVFGDGDGE